MKKYIRDYSVLFLIAGAIVAFDQYTKMVVRANLQIGQIWSPWDWLTPYARFVHWYNTGVAFGMFQGFGQLFTVLAIAVAVAIVVYYPRVRPEDWLLRLAMAMQLGGAVGNLVDRVTVGHVTDFISIGDFAVFNIADSSITLGVAVMILGAWMQERRSQPPAENHTPASSGTGLDATHHPE